MSSAEEKRQAKAATIAELAAAKGDKDLTLSLKTVTKIKDSNFQRWRDQMQRVAYSNGWHRSIMESLVDPVVPDSADDTDKHDADVRHAYLLIMHTTDGSNLEDVLQPCTLGDARQAYGLVHNHYHRRTLAGGQSAQAKFFNASMANTNTNVGQWMAVNARNAIDLNAHSGSVTGIIDNKRELLQLISGLLPEFEAVKNYVMFNDGITLAQVKYKLHDFAASNKLETLTKGGPGSVGKNNVLMIHDKNASKKKQGGKGSGNTPGPLAPGVIDLTPSKQPSTPGVVDCKNHVNRGWCGYNPCKFNHPPDKKGPQASVNLLNSNLPLIDSVFSIDCRLDHVDAVDAENDVPTARAAARRQRKVEQRFRNFNRHEAFAQVNQHPTPYRPVAAGPTKPPFFAKISDGAGLTNGLCLEDYDSDEWDEAEARELRSMHPHSIRDPTVPQPKIAAFTIYSMWLLMTVCGLHLASYFMAALATVTSSVLRGSQRFTNGGNFWMLLAWFTVAMYACTAGASCNGTTPTVHAHDFVENALFTTSDTPTCREPGYEWCSDSGTNRFVTNDARDFVPGSIIHEPTVVAVGGGVVTSTQSGTVRIRSNDHNHRITCENVLFLPQCSKKLMPASSFVRKGCTLSYTADSKCYLTDKHNNPIFTGKEIDGLYYFNGNTQHDDATANENNSNFSANTTNPASTYFGLKPGNITASAQDFPERLYEAHCAYGHIHFDKLRKLLGLKKGNNPNCEACTTAKSRAEHLTGQTYVRSTRPGHRVHMDVGFTANSDFVFQLYCDDYDRYCYIDMLSSKDQSLPCWVNLKHTIENDVYPSKVAIIRTDSEPLYRSASWLAHTTDNHIEHEYSSRYRHDQNSVVEGKMNPMGATFRAQMIQGCAPACDQPDALVHSVVILNNSPTKANNGWTPREKRLGMKLPVNAKLLRGALFCLVFAHVYEEERTKHAPRGVACIYLGYDQINNTYLVKEWSTGQRYYTADLTFHPSTFPYRANPQRTIGTLQQYDDIAPFLTSDAGPRVPAVPAPRGKSTRIRTDVYAKSGGVDLRDIPDSDTSPDGVIYMLHSFGPDPASMKEALHMWDSEDWIAAELEEKNSFKHHDVYEVVLRSSVPNGRRVFKPRPVLTRKINPPDEFNPNGSINKNKFRMTIAAYTKMLKQGIDYEEKHASTVRWNTIKIIFAIAVRFDLDVITTDIKTFFLYGKLTDSIHMEIPEGWGEDGKDGPDYVWRLKKSVYGLPQAGNCAQKDLRQTLGGSGLFNASKADECVYVTKDHSDGYGACGTFVDDIIVAGEPAGTAKFVSTLESRYDITVSRDPKIFCGVQIERSREHKWLKLHQQAYTTDLLKKYDRATTNSVDTPMDPGTAKHLMLLPTDEATPASIKAYQEIVGALMWLLRTRPDMAYTVNLLSRYLKCATPKHLAIATGRPLKYLANTTSFGIVFSPGGDDDEWVLSGAADSDLAGDVNTSRSTSGGMAALGRYGNVSSSSRLDKKISTSTGQAETYAFQDLCKEIIWIRLLLYELGYGQSKATDCFTDNDGVLSQATKSVNHATAKHYRIAQAFIRMLSDDEEIKAGRVDSEDNPADTFTKPLPRAAFQHHRLTIMGPQTKPRSA